MSGSGSGFGLEKIMDPDMVCPERLGPDPDPVCAERLDPDQDPVNTRPDPKSWSFLTRIMNNITKKKYSYLKIRRRRPG